jgi:hypothetical protein
MNSPGPAPPEQLRPARTATSRELFEPNDSDRADVVWQELEAMFRWYDGRAHRNRLAYQTLKVIALLLAATVTVLAAQDAASWLTATLAAVIVAIEGMQQLFQLHANWISYRASAEALRQEAFAYVAHVAPYDTAQRRVLLAQTLRNIATKEGTTWAKTVQQRA